MTPGQLATLRMALGVTLAVALAYGLAWPLYLFCPLFAAVFLLPPVWIGWRKALLVLVLLLISLVPGIFVSEVLLRLPQICIPLMGLAFFFIYYNDTPQAPPLASTFMTLGLTIIPVLGLTHSILPHVVATGMLVNMAIALGIARLAHILMPNSLARPRKKAPPPRPQPPPTPPAERARLALVSTIVALSAACAFFSIKQLGSYSYAMLQVCLMAGSPGANASLKSMQGKVFSCFLGGVAMVAVYQLLLIMPDYSLLVLACLATTLIFARRTFSGGPYAMAWFSGLTTFYVLLGTSTMPEAQAGTQFLARILQILAAGLFAVGGLVVVERLLRGRKVP